MYIPTTTLTTGEGGDFTLIAEQTAVGGTDEFDFTGIPQTYTSLHYYILSRSDAAADFATIFGQYNGDTTAVYDRIDSAAHQGTGVFQVTNVGQTAFWAGEATAANDAAGYPGSTIGFIPFYTETTFFQLNHAHAVFLNANSLETGLFGGFWNSTDAVTRVRFFITSGDFVAGSKARLYGVT